MRDDERGVFSGETFDGVGHQHLAFSIERAGRFVEQQHRAIGEDGAGDGDALTLTAGEAHATFAKLCFEPLRQRLCKLGHMRRVARRTYIGVACRKVTIAHIFGNAAGEDHRILRHQREAFAQRVEISLFHIDAVDRNGSCLRVIKTQQQLKHRALASAARADERHHFTGFHSE